MNYKKLESQYNKIYSYFKTTTEPFDYLEYEGKDLQVWNKSVVIERYSKKDVKEIFLNYDYGNFYKR
ncbi:MAG: hypothetical protein Q7R99_01335 [bacterium]|nr:hypothetical protein [bacterium]